MEDDKSITRLHITPLDSNLLGLIIPAAILPRAANISYHNIETFPEKRYGFVDLPVADAEKIRKKLNGAVLKGSKIRIEKARPDDMPKPPSSSENGEKATTASGDAAAAVVKQDKSHKSKDKKRKRDGEEIVGVELEEGRKVKRGWTVTESSKSKDRNSKDKKDKKSKDKDKDKDKDRKEKKHRKKEVRSQYTDGPECLVKTVLPAGSAAVADSTDGSKKHKSKSKGKDKSKTVIVHEFENTTKFPTFLKSSNAGKTTKSSATEFVEGVGWVDEDGNVVEPVRSNRRAAAAAPTPKSVSPPIAAPSRPAAEKADDSSSSSSGSDSDSDGTSSDDNSDEEDLEQASGQNDAAAAEAPQAKTKPLPSPISIPPASKVTKPGSGEASSISKTDSPRPKSASSVRSLTIKIPPATPAASKVHPLEALYKRLKPSAEETPGGSGGGGGGGQTATTATEPSASSSFAFFDDDDDEDNDNDGGDELPAVPSSQQPPMTPFTREDFEHRHMRSAAPTPDTAHHSRSFRFWSQGNSDDDIAEEDEEDEEENGGRGGKEEEADVDVDDENEKAAEDEDGDHSMMDSSPAGGVSEKKKKKGVASSGDGDGAAATADQAETSSDFQKWFWEHRGDLNRAWRKRRKVAAKDKRYRDNKSRASRAI